MASQLASQFSWVLFGRVLAAAIQAGLVIVLARALGPTEFGILSAVLGVTIVLQAVADLGLAKMILRERADGSLPQLVAGGLWLNSVSTRILGGIVGIGLLLLGLIVNSVYLLMIPLAISVAGEKNADTWLGIALADGDAKLNTINLVSRRAASLLLFIVISKLGLNPMLAYSVSVAAAAVGSVLFAKSVVGDALRGERTPLKTTLKVARPYWANTLSSQLRNLDVAIVGSVAAANTAGFYATAARLSGPLRMLPTSLGVVLLPRAAQVKGGSIKPIVKILAVTGPLFAFMYLALAFVVPWLVELALGGEYEPVVLPLQIVLFGLVFAAISSLVEPVLQGVGLQKSVAFVSVVTTFYILICMALLTAWNGEVGAAIALASGFVIESLGLLVVAMFQLPRRKYY